MPAPEKTQVAAPWRWLLGWLFHIARFLARQLWRLLSWSIARAEKFEATHPEYEPHHPVGVPPTPDRRR